ncbi:MAG: methyltransferase domain-containing protein [Rhodospirillales bacterium]|nr:methyltransferase domain-containing protein [Rhodospirillales bacterium]
MRRRHFAAFAPHCPRCAADGAGRHPLQLADVRAAQDEDVIAGILHCSRPECRHEYPIIDGVPLILPGLRPLLAERGIELMLRDDLDPALESLLGDAIGPASWFDTLRQTLSTYAWDGWADLDPEEPVAPDSAPGAVRRCLARLLDLAGPGPAARVLDPGCGAGRTSFDLAAAAPGALVLGLDLNLALLRLAQRAARGGTISYPRRRVGLVYDRRHFAVDLPGAERVDFWACDALALPFAPGAADLVAALNLLDCVAEPARLLAELAAALAPGGRLLLATPYDWSARATPLETWIGGHSQRGAHQGAAEPLLRALLTADAHPRSVSGLAALGEDPAFPWQTRLHDRATMRYASHLLALRRDA